MTSPNMKTFTPVLYGTREVLLLQDLHYGYDDPLLFPQPYDKRIPHLAVLRHPSKFADREIIFWFKPERAHFDTVDPSDPGQLLGHIHTPYRDLLKGEYLAIRRRIQAASQETNGEALCKDGKVLSYTARVKYLLGRLALPATYEESVMAWRLAQRTLLELDARVVWLVDIRQASAGRDKRAPLLNVVGSLTDQLDVAEQLFRCGIPVWLLRPLGADIGVHVGKWYDGIPADQLPMRDFGLPVILKGSSPYPVIFTGKAGNVERYRAMGTYVWGLAFPKCTLYGDDEEPVIDYGPVQPPSVANTSYTQSAPGPSRMARSEIHRTHPYKRPYPPGKAPTRASERNKFLDTPSPLLPSSLDTWVQASSLVGQTFDHSQRGRPGVNRGYVLPDPNIIAGHANEKSRAAYFTTYLKLRYVLFYRIALWNVNALSQNDWRKLIGMELHGSRQDTKSARSRLDLQMMLMEGIDTKMNTYIDFHKLDDLVVQWRGVTLQPFVHPTQQICREILWEINEICFRHELVSLDARLYTYKPKGFDANLDDEDREIGDFDELDAAGVEERRVKILSFMPHFNGRVIPEGNVEGQKGFASKDSKERQEACWALFCIMRGWKNTSPNTDEAGLKLVPTKSVTDVELEVIEHRLAYHYISCFSHVFKRAPILPRRL